MGTWPRPPAAGPRPIWALAVRDGTTLPRARTAFVQALAGAADGANLSAAASVFGELANNVARHAPGPALVRLTADGDGVRLTIDDAGSGFPAGAGSLAHPHAESGRGLRIVRAQVRRLRITARSPFGTRAEVELPIRIPESAALVDSAGADAAFAHYELECWLLRNADALAERIERSAKRELRMFFHAAPGEHTAPHLAPSVRALASAVGLGITDLYVRDARWVGRIATARGLEGAVVLRCWNRFFGVLALNAPAAHKATLRAIGEAIVRRSAPPSVAEPHPFAVRYTDALGRSVVEARALLRELRAGGAGIASLYDDVLAHALRETGRAWQRATLDIAEEHLRSAEIAARIGELRAPLAHAPRLGRLLAVCAPDEQHELGLRMLANLAEDAGWEVCFIGGRVPADAILAAALRHRPDVIALSATMTESVTALVPLVARLRAEPALQGTALIAGGAPFACFPDLRAIVGVDATAHDAAAALAVLARFARSPDASAQPASAV